MSVCFKPGDLLEVQDGMKLSLWAIPPHTETTSGPDQWARSKLTGWLEMGTIVLYIGYTDEIMSAYYHPVLLGDEIFYLEFRKDSLRKVNV